jgi:hypothetical protein
MSELTLNQRILFGVLLFLGVAILLVTAVIIALAVTGAFNSSSSAPISSSSLPALGRNFGNGLPPHPQKVMNPNQKSNNISETVNYPVPKNFGCKSCNG